VSITETVRKYTIYLLIYFLVCGGDFFFQNRVATLDCKHRLVKTQANVTANMPSCNAGLPRRCRVNARSSDWKTSIVAKERGPILGPDREIHTTFSLIKDFL